MMVELGVRGDHLLINELAILIHAGSLFAWPDMLDHDFSSYNAPMLILIVEDNPDILLNLYSFLEPKGYTVDSARNGYGGLALASENLYDVIILDVMLPG